MKQNTKKDLSELISTHDLAVDYFMPMFEQGYENQRFRRGIHWTEKQKKAHAKEKRHPYAVTLTATKFNRHLAEQRANRTGWKATGRGEEDELQAELDTQVFKYVEDINKFKWTESEIYEDALGKKWGVLVISPDYDKNPLGEVKLKRWKWDQVVWDVNSIEYDLNEDCSFIDRFEWYTRDEVARMYPDMKKKLKLTPSDFENDTEIRRNLKNYYFRDNGQDRIKLIWRQTKEYKKVWKLIPLKPGMEVQEFNSLKEAEAGLDALIMQTLQIDIITPEIAPAVMEIKKNFRIEDVITCEVKEVCWTGTQILEEKVIDWTDKFTVIPYFALKDDEYAYNLIDLVKDPQRGFDRLFSMIDKSINKNIKGNNYALDETKVRPEVLLKLDYHIKQMVEGGHILPTLGQDALKAIETSKNVQVEMTLIQMMQSLIEDLMGGNTFAGLESKAKQTATEASILEKAARLGTYLFIDNLMRWKQIAGEVLYDCILNTYPYEMKLNISGESLGQKIQQTLSEAGIYKMSDNYDGQGYLTYNPDGKRLRQNKMNLMVTETELSETTRALQYEQLKEYSAQMVAVGGMPAPPEVMLSNSNLPATVKAGMQKYYAEQQKAIAEQATQQAKLEEMKVLADITSKTHTALKENEEPKAA